MRGKVVAVVVTTMGLIPTAYPGDVLLIDVKTGRVRAVVKMLGDD